MSNDPRYPIGKWKEQPATTVATLIDQIAAAPANLTAAVKGLTDAELDTPYRDGGWTPRQIVHHIADSHMNAYIRFKLALTEDMPPAKPYDEAKWAELIDARTAPVSESLALLEALHSRWVVQLKAMTGDEFRRRLNHPEWDTPPYLDDMLAMYGWHSRHHTAHITELRKREGWK